MVKDHLATYKCGGHPPEQREVSVWRARVLVLHAAWGSVCWPFWVPDLQTQACAHTLCMKCLRQMVLDLGEEASRQVTLLNRIEEDLDELCALVLCKHAWCTCAEVSCMHVYLSLFPNSL